ncbi:hypothetical protein Tco_1102645 [Tanacetum coccineum]
MLGKNDDALILKKWAVDDEEEIVCLITITEKIIVKLVLLCREFVKPKQQEKTVRKTVKQDEKHRQNTHSPRGNQRNWNNMMSQKLGRNFEMFNKACYVYGSFDHLQVDCNYHQKLFQNQRMVKPVWNNAQRVNHQNFAKKTHPCAKKNMVPRAVLMKSGLVLINTARQNISKITISVNTARQVNTAHSKTTMNVARPMSYLYKTTHSTVKRPIHKNTSFKNSNIYQRVNTVSGKKINTARPKAVVNDVKGNSFNVVKASACWVWKSKTKVLDHGNPQMDLQDQSVIDSRCSRHMTVNMSYLTDYEEIDGGYVAFEGNPKGGKIIGKEVYLLNFLKMIKPVLLVKRESSTEPLVCQGFLSSTKDELVALLKSFKTGIGNLEITGSGLDWLFDIDALTRIMKYEPIVAGTQSNGFAGNKNPKRFPDDGSKLQVDDGKGMLMKILRKVSEEPKRVIHALKDPSWIEAMQEELLQFKLQEVWTLVV